MTADLTGAGSEYVDDGSGLRDGTLTNERANVGIRVIFNPAGYGTRDYLIVTGISSCYVLEGNVYRAVRVWRGSDVASL